MLSDVRYDITSDFDYREERMTDILHIVLTILALTAFSALVNYVLVKLSAKRHTVYSEGTVDVDSEDILNGAILNIDIAQDRIRGFENRAGLEGSSNSESNLFGEVLPYHDASQRIVDAIRGA
jgi:hypothetical protein